MTSDITRWHLTRDGPCPFITQLWPYPPCPAPSPFQFRLLIISPTVAKTGNSPRNLSTSSPSDGRFHDDGVMGQVDNLSPVWGLLTLFYGLLTPYWRPHLMTTLGWPLMDARGGGRAGVNRGTLRERRGKWGVKGQETWIKLINYPLINVEPQSIMLSFDLWGDLPQNWEESDAQSLYSNQFQYPVIIKY